MVALRGSKTTSSMTMRWKRSSRARSFTDSIRFMRAPSRSPVAAAHCFASTASRSLPLQGRIGLFDTERRLSSPEGGLEDLACRVPGQGLVDQLDVLGHLEGGQARGAEGLDVLGGHRGPRPQLDDGLDLLTQRAVGNAHDGGVDDLWVLVEDVLDLDAVD